MWRLQANLEEYEGFEYPESVMKEARKQLHPDTSLKMEHFEDRVLPFELAPRASAAGVCIAHRSREKRHGGGAGLCGVCLSRDEGERRGARRVGRGVTRAQVTKADEECDRRSLERALTKSVFLLIKGSDGAWKFPESDMLDDEETPRVSLYSGVSLLWKSATRETARVPSFLRRRAALRSPVSQSIDDADDALRGLDILREKRSRERARATSFLSLAARACPESCAPPRGLISVRSRPIVTHR